MSTRLTTLLRVLVPAVAVAGTLMTGGCASPETEQANRSQQTIEIGPQGARYPFVVFANHDLQASEARIEQAVVILHGVKRNADTYFATGRKLLKLAQLPNQQTLLLAPNFLTEADRRASNDLPLWRKDNWMQGEPSGFGLGGISSFQALDDVVRYLADRQRFPALKRITLIGHSAGAQLMQRYAVLNPQDESLRQSGIDIRYVISSPSTYVYFDANRPQSQGFAPVVSIMCPSYNRYRYGIDAAPAYLQVQHLSAEQLFRRYAGRDVTYLVGSKDNDPANRIMDKSCGAGMQGATRVERQLNYLAYERFLGQNWNIPVQHPQFQVPGIGHSANGLYTSPLTAERLFPAR
ncbi:hypothetical protein [Pseudomonas gingeri]|uniref:Alpha/beta hydrolase n=1 Tax=Pseudomonas gingeri TaxID=117681 RepID=A0A7Y7YA15_9PSED|nr:hypothetical protein [Pseudomonas gingeri]NWA01732.1 hypothetical protein [Pseudomonas gingeri]NWA12831.1 hypothetical protein [Pseudomonas gingeri]NWA57573.1 hypothetical protein [Pseudomonas gingeri]NWA93202.1 hypothetical protein [Pseudomonas gingeri]NWB03438.1 hypothetical protein [Pseudomonas gingeri]